MNRRHFLHTSAGLLATGALVSSTAAQESKAPPAGVPKPPAKPPALPPVKVQEIVGQSHRSLDAVRALIAETPTLANATWDWGGGDFETPLQAAAHTGQREIAEFLLSHGARFDIYAAAMLGQLDAVKGIIGGNVVAGAAVPGPHGFTLLHCAKKGGERARSVYDFLVGAGVPETIMLALPYKWPAGTGPGS